MKKKTYQDWFDKYYPVPARKMKGASMVEAVQHSLNKWTGLEHLYEYDMEIEFGDVRYGNKDLMINSETCALCVKYLNEHPADSNKDKDCSQCPLCIVRDGVPCDERRPDEEWSPYAMRMDGEFGRMISWLRRALKYAQKESR